MGGSAVYIPVMGGGSAVYIPVMGGGEDTGVEGFEP